MSSTHTIISGSPHYGHPPIQAKDKIASTSKKTRTDLIDFVVLWKIEAAVGIGGRLGFSPANAFKKCNAHSYPEDAEQKDMYFYTE